MDIGCGSVLLAVGDNDTRHVSHHYLLHDAILATLKNYFSNPYGMILETAAKQFLVAGEGETVLKQFESVAVAHLAGHWGNPDLRCPDSARALRNAPRPHGM